MKTKIAMAIATGTLLAATVLPAAAFASSRHYKPPKPQNNTDVKQINKSFVFTGVLSVAGTGGNTITGNTGNNTWSKWHQDGNEGGDAKNKTGDAKSVVDVTVG